MPGPLVKDGAFTRDTALQLPVQLYNTVAVNTLTNPTSATQLFSYNLLPNTLNGAGRGLEITVCGTESLSTSNSTVVVAVVLGSVTLATFTTASITAGAGNLGWNLQYNLFVNALGTSGTIESFGNLLYQTAAATYANLTSSNTAVSSAVDLTQQQTLAVNVNLGTGNASSNIVGRLFSVFLVG